MSKENLSLDENIKGETHEPSVPNSSNCHSEDSFLFDSKEESCLD